MPSNQLGTLVRPATAAPRWPRPSSRTPATARRDPPARREHRPACGGGLEAATEVTQGMSVVLPLTLAPPTLPPPATEKAWRGTDREIVLQLIDGTGRSALYQFR